jgi:hypothetical protein
MQDNQTKRSAVAGDLTTEATAAESSPARSGASRSDGGGAGEVAEGTPSSNTVPSKDNTDKFKALRFGVDSLYLSYHGQLFDEWNIKLDELKTKAQSEIETEQALAQVCIGSHIFEVRDKGVPRFPYVLVDNCFFIKINRKLSKTLPMAHVQISSEYLAAVGLDAAEKDLRIVINTLGLVEGVASVSRADLFLDFVSLDNLADIEQPDWITRANLMAKYFDCRLTEPFTGWVIGMGGNLHARLYEKVVEIVNKSHKTYLFELWQANGWQAGEKVWRMEFQTEKQTLKELGILTLSDLLDQQAALWHYLTLDWLRLSIPNPNDSKRDRWPNHPLWDALANVYDLPLDQPRLQRFRPARLPADERLFVHGLGGFTSFMASRGIEDFGEGLGEYLAQAKEFHASKGEAFHSYVERKVKAKSRKYNTIHNQMNMKDASRRLAEEAEAYRREKDGDDGDA